MRKNQSVLKVGVTGSIGSGKSEVCKIFEQLGVPVLYADHIAKEITENDRDVKREIKKVFGADVFDRKGILNRKKMAGIVFADERLRSKLNRIIHPKVFVIIDREIEHLSALGKARFLIVEAALIYETGMEKNLHYVIVVNADEDVRIRRVMKRDGCSREEVESRIASQMPAEEKVKRAEFVTGNNGTKEELAEKVKFLYSLLESSYNVPPRRSQSNHQSHKVLTSPFVRTRKIQVRGT